LFVFHRSGQRIKTFIKAWRTACRRAGVKGRLVHDLRRTAARDFRRRGVSEGEIMRLCGWKTRAMFDRYNVIDPTDLSLAVGKRFNGKHAANSETEVPPQV
jgi:integrase